MDTNATPNFVIHSDGSTDTYIGAVSVILQLRDLAKNECSIGTSEIRIGVVFPALKPDRLELLGGIIGLYLLQKTLSSNAETGNKSGLWCCDNLTVSNKARTALASVEAESPYFAEFKNHALGMKLELVSPSNLVGRERHLRCHQMCNLLRTRSERELNGQPYIIRARKGRPVWALLDARTCGEWVDDTPPFSRFKNAILDLYEVVTIAI